MQTSMIRNSAGRPQAASRLQIKTCFSPSRGCPGVVPLKSGLYPRRRSHRGTEKLGRVSSSRGRLGSRAANIGPPAKPPNSAEDSAGVNTDAATEESRSPVPTNRGVQRRLADVMVALRWDCLSGPPVTCGSLDQEAAEGPRSWAASRLQEAVTGAVPLKSGLHPQDHRSRRCTPTIQPDTR